MNSHATCAKVCCAAIVLACMFFTAASTAMSAEKNLHSCLDPLKKSPLPAYAANKLSSIEQDIAGFEKRSLVTTNEEETIHELVRILKSTKSKYEAINHYVFGWSTTIEYLYRANVETAKRGVEVSRIFIVSDDVLSNRSKLEALIKVMDMQKRDGIKVSYGLRRDLEKDANYHPYALLDLGLSDDAVLAKVTAVSLMGPQPAGLQITWDESDIKAQNPFPYLKKSLYIFPYDESSADKLLALAAKEAAPPVSAK